MKTVHKIWFWRRFYIHEESEVTILREYALEILQHLPNVAFHIIGPYFKKDEDYVCYFDFRIGLGNDEATTEQFLGVIKSKACSLDFKDIPIDEFYTMYSHRFSDAQMTLILSHFMATTLDTLVTTDCMNERERDDALMELLHLINFNYGEVDFRFACNNLLHSTKYLGYFVPIKKVKRLQWCIVNGLKLLIRFFDLNLPNIREGNNFLLDKSVGLGYNSKNEENKNE